VSTCCLHAQFTDVLASEHQDGSSRAQGGEQTDTKRMLLRFRKRVAAAKLIGVAGIRGEYPAFVEGQWAFGP